MEPKTLHPAGAREGVARQKGDSWLLFATKIQNSCTWRSVISARRFIQGFKRVVVIQVVHVFWGHIFLLLFAFFLEIGAKISLVPGGILIFFFLTSSTRVRLIAVIVQVSRYVCVHHFNSFISLRSIPHHNINAHEWAGLVNFTK